MNPGFVYLDNAATSWPKQPVVAATMAQFLAERAGNPGRGGHALARAAAESVEEARLALAGLVNAPRPERVVLTHGCTDSINLAVRGRVEQLCRCPSDEPPHVVTTVVEHNAVSRTLHGYAKADLIGLTFVGCDEQGWVDPDEYADACNERTVLACLSHASNAIGTIQSVQEVGERVRERSPDALFLVDAAQTLGHIDVDVQRLDIDLLAIAGHKGLGGPTGTGALYVGPRAFTDAGESKLFCTRSGGTGMMAPGLEMPTDLPDALEAGTENAVGYAGLVAAINSIDPRGHEREMDLAMDAIERLSRIEGVCVHGRTSREGRTSVVLFSIEGVPAREVGRLLDAEHDVAVRGGTHCAPLLHQAIGTGEEGAVRASPGPMSTPQDIDRLIESVRVIVRSRAGARS